MIKKEDYTTSRVIVSLDNFEKAIRSYKRAIAILEEQHEEDCQSNVEVEYPLHDAINLLKAEMWMWFDEMCAQKASYDNAEWGRLYEAHKAKIESQKEGGKN